jgi:hypothetical protein
LVGRIVVEVAVDTVGVELVDPSERVELDVLDRFPSTLVGASDQLRLVEALGRFGEGMIVGIADTADRGPGADPVESFVVADG